MKTARRRTASEAVPEGLPAAARNQMQRSELGLMGRPETSRVSRCPTQASSSWKPGLFFESKPRRVAVEGGHEHIPRRHVAAEATQAAAPEATEAATAATCRIARAPTHGYAATRED